MANTKFQEVEKYAAPDGSYQLIPFNIDKIDEESFFISNVSGDYCFITPTELDDLVNKELSKDANVYKELKSRHFLYEDNYDLPLDILSTRYRTKKSSLNSFTALHMFVVTLRCDLSCSYCQVSRQTQAAPDKYDMSEDTADKFIDMMFKSPSTHYKVEFQGGEPLVNFKLIKYIVGRVNHINETANKNVEFVIATNLNLINDEILKFVKEHTIYLSTSLDGPQHVHDHNRNKDSHSKVTANIKKVQDEVGHDYVAALMTTTNKSLQHPNEIVDEYVRLGLNQIFLRAISPYGFALRSTNAKYATNEFIRFYKEALDYIINLNKQGTVITEVYATIILSKILTPFTHNFVDLLSPAGTGIAAISYNYDGDIYASDESRMLAEAKDDTFKLGNVHENSYKEIFLSPTLIEMINSSCLEANPMCNDCAYNPYCGTDPVHNHQTQGDVQGIMPQSGFCTKNMAVIKLLLSYIKENDPETMDVFYSWVNRIPLES